jgi:hypothetical protein
VRQQYHHGDGGHRHNHDDGDRADDPPSSQPVTSSPSRSYLGPLPGRRRTRDRLRDYLDKTY